MIYLHNETQSLAYVQGKKDTNQRKGGKGEGRKEREREKKRKRRGEDKERGRNHDYLQFLSYTHRG